MAKPSDLRMSRICKKAPLFGTPFCLDGFHPLKVEAFNGNQDGGILSDRFVIKIWALGSDPDVDELLHKASGDLRDGQIKIHQN